MLEITLRFKITILDKFYLFLTSFTCKITADFKVRYISEITSVNQKI